MFNKTGIEKTVGAAPRQILANVEHFVSFGIVVDSTLGVTVGSKKIAKAGTPVAGSLDARGTAFLAPADTSVKGVYTFQITAAFIADEKITIEGVDYTAKAVEDVAAKQFAVGASVADQVASLLKMVAAADFDVAAVAGATDKIQLTQKVASRTNPPTVTKTSATGKIGPVIEVVEPEIESNAVGVLLHDVDVTAGDSNGTVLTFGWVNTNRLETDVVALLTPTVKKALEKAVTFIAC